MPDIRRASLDEIRAMKARGELYETRPDAPEYDLPDDFWENAEVWQPMTKMPVTMRVAPDILEFF